MRSIIFLLSFQIAITFLYFKESEGELLNSLIWFNARFETFFFHAEAFASVLIVRLLELLATSVTIIGSTP